MNVFGLRSSHISLPHGRKIMHSAPLPSAARIFFLWKGRVALYAILKALGVRAGDEVVLPGFTCVAVPNAVLYLGARPVYADIDPRTYNVTADTIGACISARTRVVIAQNTFGLSADLDPIMQLAADRDLRVVEDCAHGLGGSYHGRANGTVAHAAFFSSQWSKPISTGLGGVALTCDDEVAERIAQVIAAFSTPGFAKQAMLGAQLLARPLATRPLLYYPLLGAYRFLTQRMGLSVGSSVPQELANGSMPDGYCQQMGRLQRGIWNRRINSVATLVAQRQEVARHYDALVAETGIVPPARPVFAEHAMLRYAVRVADKRLLLETARGHRLPVGDWFCSPLHPIERSWHRWGYQRGQCPVAERTCAELVNFFTDRPLPKEGMMRLLAGQAVSRTVRRAG